MNRRFEVRVMPWPEALPLARPMRERVFIEEQRVPRELEWDDRDAESDHAVAFDAQGSAVGTARLLPEGRVGRMAVLAHRRGMGAGTALLEALLELAAAKGMAEVRLHAQTHAAGFYRRFGFAIAGEEFLEAGIPHVEMMLKLARPSGA